MNPDINIEIHVLQNFAPSCLNRDDTNSPKNCEFGGHRSARISSQCIKRAIRHCFARAELLAEADRAERTKRLDKAVKQRLAEGRTAAEVARADGAALAVIGAT